MARGKCKTKSENCDYASAGLKRWPLDHRTALARHREPREVLYGVSLSVTMSKVRNHTPRVAACTRGKRMDFLGELGPRG